MITYKTCTEVTYSQMFEAFSLGFSDYILPMSMKEEEFVEHFFGPEGNTLEHSFIAFDDSHPIGLILGGIRVFDGMKTMRCGTLCLAPDYRGKGISIHLYEMHKATAEACNCKQLFLEVITENHRAVKFYENLGYRRSTLLKYYTGTADTISVLRRDLSYSVNKLTYEDIRNFREELKACHINWQCDTPYYEKNTSDTYLGVAENDRIIARIAMNPRGKINFLWVEQAYRNMGIGQSLVLEAMKLQGTAKVSVTVTSNAVMEGFLRKLNFHKETIEQFEMHLPI